MQSVFHISTAESEERFSGNFTSRRKKKTPYPQEMLGAQTRRLLVVKREISVPVGNRTTFAGRPAHGLDSRPNELSVGLFKMMNWCRGTQHCGCRSSSSKAAAAVKNATPNLTYGSMDFPKYETPQNFRHQKDDMKQILY